MNDTKPDLDAIEARAEAATEGPWEQRQNAPTMGGAVWTLRTTGQPGIRATVTEYQHGPANAEFIAHAREDVPALVAYARTLEDENERQRAALVSPDEWDAALMGQVGHSQRPLGRAEAAEAERGRLTQRLSPWDEACDAVGIPRGDVDGFIRHHRGNAALIAVTDADTEARRMLDQIRALHTSWKPHHDANDRDGNEYVCGCAWCDLWRDLGEVLDGDQQTEEP